MIIRWGAGTHGCGDILGLSEATSVLPRVLHISTRHRPMNLWSQLEHNLPPMLSHHGSFVELNHDQETKQSFWQDQKALSCCSRGLRDTCPEQGNRVMDCWGAQGSISSSSELLCTTSLGWLLFVRRKTWGSPFGFPVSLFFLSGKKSNPDYQSWNTI